MNIRLLKASEIECRIGTNKATGMSLLLYKDARVDMRILDEKFGFDGWEREHQLIDGKLFCTVRVWSEKRNCWVSKQDVGTESNTEKEKGQVSDSFKRACFNLGIGRELYTSPFIWIPASKGYDKYEKFKVVEIGYNDEREINKLVIADSNGNKCFEFGKKTNQNKDKSNNASDSNNLKNNIKKVEDKNTGAYHVLNKEEKEKLFMVAKGLDTKIVKEILYSFGFESSGEVTSDKLEDIIKTIEKTKENINLGFKNNVVKELIKDTRNGY